MARLEFSCASCSTTAGYIASNCRVRFHTLSLPGAVELHPEDTPTSTVEGPDVMVDPPQQGAGGDVAEENIGTNGNAHPSPVNREVLVHTFQGQLNNMLIDQVRMQRQLRDVMRTMQDWSQEHERIAQLLRRIQEIMDPEVAPGMPLHGLRVP